MLDPHLDHRPFSAEEKEYIYKWVEKYRKTNNGNIQWKFLQPEMKKKFGKLRSLNDLKNVWNVRKRRLERLAKNDDEIVTRNNFHNNIPIK
ncbi:hypothetical protein C1645_775208 [Glomus cerebriforme]|uniref:Myb-like domain-containing protein n=1 Tax=Glomus cerebriforme TaxID=658196 RepID=A0A397STT5_9GLOM|nr:hypothetical protein C1645_775208 [Glomus cerebriforme]